MRAFLLLSLLRNHCVYPATALCRRNGKLFMGRGQSGPSGRVLETAPARAGHLRFFQYFYLIKDAIFIIIYKVILSGR